MASIQRRDSNFPSYILDFYKNAEVLEGYPVSSKIEDVPIHNISAKGARQILEHANSWKIILRQSSLSALVEQASKGRWRAFALSSSTKRPVQTGNSYDLPEQPYSSTDVTGLKEAQLKCTVTHSVIIQGEIPPDSTEGKVSSAFKQAKYFIAVLDNDKREQFENNPTFENLKSAVSIEKALSGESEEDTTLINFEGIYQQATEESNECFFFRKKEETTTSVTYDRPKDFKKILFKHLGLFL